MPVREEPWSYAFIADFEGHADDAPVKGALSELSEVCAKVRFHGSYPRMVG
jgi:prephenate dehydratase